MKHIQTFRLLVGLLTIGGTSVVVRAAAPDRAPIVVSSAWLSVHLHDKNLVLIQAGTKPEEYATHIPGARYLDQTEIATTDREIDLPDLNVFRARLTELGVSDKSRVVVYGAGDWASRLVMTLQAAGLTDVSLLDGGIAAWTAGGGAVTPDKPAITHGKISAGQAQPVVVDAEFVRAHLQAPGFRIIDARSQNTHDNAGGIPGSGVVHASEVSISRISPYITLKPRAELDAMFTSAGVKPGDTVIVYCAVGLVATTTMIAAETLGHPVLLYDGSFQDWARRGLPIEKKIK